jgi:Mg-chelatase subunit ChlD
MIEAFGFDRPEILWALLALPVWWALPFFGRRRLGLRRRLLAVALRTALWVALTLAAAGLTRRTTVDDLAVVFVLDRSASVGPLGRDDGVAFVRAALEARRPHDLAGVVVVGSDALIEAEPRSELTFSGVESSPDPNQTDLASGVRLAAALLPSDRTRRIVVVTDGEETRGDAARQVLAAAEEDLEVSVVKVGRGDHPEIIVEDLLAPSHVDQGAAYEVHVVVRSDLAGDARLRVWRNEAYLGEVPVHLDAGHATVIPLGQEGRTPGLYRYRAVVEPDDPASDGLTENNQALGTVEVAGPARLLVVEGTPGEGASLIAAIRADGLEVDRLSPADLPPGVEGLREWAAVILVNVPAYALSGRQQASLKSAVTDLGRGLAMIGGDTSFGVGGYHGTPIEEALPVRMDLEDKSRFPKLAMVMAIDKSCSMGGGFGSKLALAQEAASLTAELLTPRDQLGVIGFDGAATWVVPLQTLEDPARVVGLINSIRIGGGTDIYPALKLGFEALQSSDAALRHTVLLSDGITAGADFQTLITGAASHGITLTAIGVGADSDRRTLADMARWGGGNWYQVEDPSAIPAIFTREALLASRSFLVEEPFFAIEGAPSEVLRGLPAADLPPFGGYVATEARPRAVVGWRIPDAEHPALPLFATIQAGLGRSAAFTSDVGSRWAGAWVRTPGFQSWSAQLGRWLVAGGETGNLTVDTEIRDGRLVVTVDAWDAQGGFRNFLDGEARVVAPDLSVEGLPLEQIAPGRYQASRPVDQDGAWLVGVSLAQGEQVVGQAVAEAVQPYSPEFRARGAGDALLAELARVGRGGVVTDPAAVFRRPQIPRRVPRPLWPLLLGLSAVLLLIDVAVRRLDLGGDPRTLASPVPGAAPTRGFRAAKAVPGTATPAAVLDDAPPPAQVDPDSYAGRLLAARRAARKKTDGDRPKDGS